MRGVRADDTDRRAAAAVANLLELVAREAQSIFPGHRLELALCVAHQRLRQPIGILHKVEPKPSLRAKEVAIDSALVAVIGTYDFRSVIRLPHAQRYLASIAAMRANGGDVIHLPGTGLVAIAAAGQCAHRAYIDAHAALLAIELVARPAVPYVRRDDRTGAAVLNAQRPNIHAFAAHTDAAIAENAARPVVKHRRRPLLLVPVMLRLGIKALARTVLEGHILQFALAARIAYRAIQRMISEQQLDRRLARLRNFRRLRNKNLTLGNGCRTRRLQLRHLFLPNNAHAASGLQAEPR